jgi:iron complex outermembrane receptor protein
VKGVFGGTSESRLGGFFASASIAVLIGALAHHEASSQTTAPGASTTPLPRIVVEGKRKQARKRAPAPVRTAAPAPSSSAPAPSAVERGAGPVGGFVARQSVSATKTDTPILETPQSISVVPKEQVEAQRAQGLQETIRYTPGGSIESNGSSSQFDYITVRGLDAPQYRDGLRLPADPPLGFARWRTEPYGLERIEVLRGPSSGIYGQGSPGGIISMVSKRPTEVQFNEVFFQAGSFQRLQGGFDFSGPATPDGTLLYRLTGLGRIADAEIDFNDEKRAFIAPALTWRPNIDTSITFLGQYQKDDIKGPPHQFIPAHGSLLPNPNGHIPRNLNVQDPNTDRLSRTQWSVGYAFEHRFDDVWQIRQNLRYAALDLSVRSMRGEGLLADQRTLQRSDFYIPANAKNFTVDNQAQADFSTGPLRHKLLLGVDYINFNSAQQMYGDFFGATPIDIFAPVYTRDIHPMVPLSDYAQHRQQVGLYAQDQIKLDGWILTLTGRQDFAQTSNTNNLAAKTTERDSQAFTGRAALGYLFENGVAPYVSYATSFDPLSEADKAGNLFVPLTGEAVEAGIKYQPTWLPKTLFSFAAFEIKQKNMPTPDPDPFAAANGFRVQTGEVRIRGVEFEAKTSFTKGFNLLAALSYLEPEIIKSNDPAELGKLLPQVPQFQAALWADYTFQTGAIAGFGLGAGVRHIGASWSDTINTPELRIPSYTLVDAALYYDFGYRFPELRGLKFDIVATNLFDKEYVAICGGFAYCNYGAGRRVLGTLTYRWGSPAASTY